MAGLHIKGTTAAIALAAATAETIIQIVSPANQRVKLKRWGVYFDGASATAVPVLVKLHVQTSAGTMSALTPAKWNSDDAETIQTTMQHTATAEPTTGAALEEKLVHPQQGYEIIYPLGDELVLPGGTKLGIVCTAPAIVNVRAEVYCEE